MRKTSHDGIDATSITSGIENEIKKAGANISKIKKSSIKRKVQNFSHDSDEGIIEPLLQIEKEKAEIANRSAKFLLNKSKTDSSYERINKSSDSFVLSGSNISTPPSSVMKVTSTTTSCTSGTTRIHNHMNVNVFNTFGVSKSIPATKNQVLIEIDGCKSGSYNPSPLIFTTAKIHTDSKSKLMEPVQTTPVPILSTIEGNVVKASTNNSEHHVNSFSTKSVDQNTNNSNKLTSKTETNELQSAKEVQDISTTVTTASSNDNNMNFKGASNLTECIISNVKESQATHVLKNIPGTSIKNQNAGQFTNNSSKTISPTTTNSSNIKNADSSVNNKFSTDSTPITTNSLKDTSMSYINQTTLSEKPISCDKNAMLSSDNKIQKTTVQPLDVQMADNKSINLKTTKESHWGTSNNAMSESKISPTAGKLVNEEMTQGVKSKESHLDNKIDNTNIVKSPISNASKKLQRQKKAAVDEISETSNISSSLSVEKSCTHDKKNVTNNDKGDYKSDGTSSIEKSSSACIKSSPIIETRQSATTSVLQKSTEDASFKSKMKSTAEMAKVKPVTCSNLEDVTKTQTKSSIVSTAPNTKDNTKSTSIATTKSQPSIKASVGNSSVMATFSKLEKSNDYTVVPTTSKVISSVKCDSTTATTLPSYIVSTSKTKIGATLTTDTLKNTMKATTQKPFAEIVYTSTLNETEKMAKTTKVKDGSKLNTSSSSSANHSNISQQTKTKTDTSFNNGRA